MALGVLMLLLVIPASLAQEDLESKVFIFPKETDTSHFILRPTVIKSLQKVSVCLRTYTDLLRPYTPFSLATPGKDNALLIYFQPPNIFSVYINQKVTNIMTDSESLDWRHTCVTWDSDTGVLQLWVNRKVYPGGVVMKGSTIAAESSIILGQEQDSFGGGFDASQSFVGEISDVHMWDYVLTPEEVQKVISDNFYGNLLNWKSLIYKIRGNALVQSKNQHLENKVFVFPNETNTAHVILKPPTTKSLQKVSICLRSYTDLLRPYAAFSLATPKMENAFLIFIQPPNICSVYINQKEINIVTDSEPLDWKHTCVTWDSDTGNVQLWVNGKFYPGGVAMKGSSIATGSIVLGQDQDNFGGGFDASQSFVGEISDVHMWDYVLNSGDVQNIISGDLHGNFLNWKSLLYEIRGNTFVQPKNLHLDSKVIVFPKETNTAHVILRPPTTKSLQKVSVCLWSYTGLQRPYTAFSLATPGKDKAFLISFQPPNFCALYINQEAIHIKIDSEPLNWWRHTCVIWDSDTGVVQLWVNGKVYPGAVAMKGSTIAAESNIVLGQDQNSFAGGFDASQSLVGEISDVHMWDYVLTPENVQKVISDDLHGNFLNWKSLLYKIRGNAFVKAKNLHLENKVFIFPKKTDTSHVILRPTTIKSLQKVSVCLRSYTELPLPYAPFCLATPGKDNAFLIYFQPPNICSVHINQEAINIKKDSKPLDWRHTCVTWDSDTGVIQLWVNGKVFPAEVVMKGSTIVNESSIVLGQDQDSFGGRFDASQSLVGEINVVQMWDFILTSYDIHRVISGDLNGNFHKWKSLLHEITGNTFIQAKNLHLENKVFVFPKETNTSHVILRPLTTKSLQKVSVCLRSYTDLTRTYPLFSLATPGKDNAFLISFQPPNICSVHINQEITNFKTDLESLDWRHTCVSWDSDTGVIQLWVNGKLYPRKVSMKGSSIDAEGSIVLGQEQDSFGGEFNASQSMVGEISDVHMWDYVLSPYHIQKVISGDLHGNVISWEALLFEIKGTVIVQPKLQHNFVRSRHIPYS
ncbi:LOW QUALITY PROTEIN: uncharacterized protein ACMZJ9_021204 [Mantella aurantiaca]